MFLCIITHTEYRFTGNTYNTYTQCESSHQSADSGPQSCQSMCQLCFSISRASPHSPVSLPCSGVLRNSAPAHFFLAISRLQYHLQKLLNLPLLTFFPFCFSQTFSAMSLLEFQTQYAPKWTIYLSYSSGVPLSVKGTVTPLITQVGKLQKLFDSLLVTSVSKNLIYLLQRPFKGL